MFAMTTITLWALWKCRCNRRYDVIYQCLSDVLREIWENLVAVVRGQYDNMHGSPETVNVMIWHGKTRTHDIMLHGLSS